MASVTVQITTAVVPNTRIYGSKDVSVFDWQPVQLHAVSTIPRCAESELSADMTYTWKVYDGVNYLPHIRSISANPKVFKLPPNSLQFGKVYTVQLVANLGAEANPIQFRAAVTVQQSPSGPTAIIAGGSEQTAIRDSEFRLDASEQLRDLTYRALVMVEIDIGKF